MTQRILLIEDEPGLVMTLTDRLSSEGYVVESATDGETGFVRAAGESFDLIILDVMLPRRNGFDVQRDLRQRGLNTPIIMLTARGEIVDKVVGLKLGADDYVCKPFEMSELLARIEAVLRRVNTPSPNSGKIYRFGNVQVDFRRAEVTVENRCIELSALEFKLMCYLIEHRGSVISRNELLNAVWGYDAMPSTRTVDVHVSGLRQKLESNPRTPQLILTVHGLGYKFTG